MSHHISLGIDAYACGKSDGVVVLINRSCNISLIGALMRNHPLDTLTASVPALTATIANTSEDPPTLLTSVAAGATAAENRGLSACNHAFKLRNSTLQLIH